MRTIWTLPKTWENDESSLDYARYEIPSSKNGSSVACFPSSLILTISRVVIPTNHTSETFFEVSLEVWLDDVNCPRYFHNYAQFKYYGPGTKEECIKKVENWAIQSGLVFERKKK